MNKKTIIIACVLVAAAIALAIIFISGGDDEKESNYIGGMIYGNGGQEPETIPADTTVLLDNTVTDPVEKPESDNEADYYPNQNNSDEDEEPVETPETEKPTEDTTKASEDTKKPAADSGCSSSGHKYGSWKETKKATCTTQGVKARTCSKCGNTEEEKTEATGHKEVSIPAKAATCASEGLSEGKKCSVCGMITVSQRTLSKLQHNYGSWSTGKAATCGSEGYDVRRCSCGAEEKRTVKATGNHNYNSSGCTVCGAALEGSKNLAYKLSSDGSYYICTGFSGVVTPPETLIIPSSYNGKPVKQVGDDTNAWAFMDAFNRIKKVIICDGVEKISRYAFLCKGLETVIIPSSVNYIEGTAFVDADMLETAYISGNSIWSDRNNNSYNLSDPYSAANTLRSGRTISR